MASEIRKLADGTKASAAEIKEAVSQLNEGMEETIKAMDASLKAASAGMEASRSVLNPFEEIEKSTRTMAELIEHLSAITEEQTTATEEIAANSTTIAEATGFANSLAKESETNVALGKEVLGTAWERLIASISPDEIGLGLFLAQRVVDHAIWIDKVVKVLKGELKDIPDLADHHKCNLEKWYYREGREAIGDYSVKVQRLFTAIEEPHRQVHEYGMQAVRAHRAGEKDSAYRTISGLSEASQRIISLFVELMREVTQ